MLLKLLGPLGLGGKSGTACGRSSSASFCVQIRAISLGAAKGLCFEIALRIRAALVVLVVAQGAVKRRAISSLPRRANLEVIYRRQDMAVTACRAL